MLTKIEVEKLIDELTEMEIETVSSLLPHPDDEEDSFEDNYPFEIIKGLYDETLLPKGLLEDIVHIIYNMESPEFDRTDSRDSELYHKALEVCKTRTPLVLLSWLCKQLENC